MLAYTTKKSYLGTLGFDSLSFYTNDDIKYTGFEPLKLDIRLIGKFVQRFNEYFFSTEPLSLIISKVGEVYVIDVKFFRHLTMTNKTGSGATVGIALADLSRKVFVG